MSSAFWLEPRVDLGGLFVGHLRDREGRVLIDPVLCSTIAQRSNHCCAVPTRRRPAVFGASDSGDGEFADFPPRPTQHLDERDRVVGETQSICASSIDRSTSSPAPSRAAAAGRQRRGAGISAGEPVADLAADEYRRRSCGAAAQPTMPPDQACRVNSVAGRSLQGPSSPNGVIDVTIRCGCDSRSAAGVKTRPPTIRATTPPRPRRPAARRRVGVAPSGSATTLCLDPARNPNSAPSPPLRWSPPMPTIGAADHPAASRP